MEINIFQNLRYLQDLLVNDQRGTFRTLILASKTHGSNYNKPRDINFKRQKQLCTSTNLSCIRESFFYKRTKRWRTEKTSKSWYLNKERSTVGHFYTSTKKNMSQKWATENYKNIFLGQNWATKKFVKIFQSQNWASESFEKIFLGQNKGT